MNTDTIQTVGTSQEDKRVMEQFFEEFGVKATRRQAVDYAQKLLDCKKRKDFTGIQNIWNSLGTTRFTRKDYIEIVKPIVDRDWAIVGTCVAKMNGAKHLGQLKRYSLLTEPIVPPAYHRWKIERDNRVKALIQSNPKLTFTGNIITNAVTK